MQLQLRNAVLYVKDSNTAKLFYTQKLGFEIAEDQGEFITFKTTAEGTCLAINQADGVEKVAGKQTVIFFAPQIAEVYEKLQQAGVAIHTELYTAPWGSTFIASDPDGNKIEYVQADTNSSYTNLYISTEDDSRSYKLTDAIGTFRCAIAAIILNSDNQVLLTQRALTNPANPGNWELVWGRVNGGEDFQKALLREVKEEVGIVVNPIGVVSTGHFYRGSEQEEHLSISYLCRLTGEQEIVPAENEVGDWKWVELSTAIQLSAVYNHEHLRAAQNWLARGLA